MKLINKDHAIAEIDKVIDEPAPSHDQQCPWEDGYYCGLYKAESIIDTLEVKEVDLEKEFNSFLNDTEGVPVMWHSIEQIEWAKDIAKHFFELGMAVSNKAQKEK